MVSKAHIICGGPACENSKESFGFKLGEGDIVIAADSGYASCLEVGTKPDLLVADFDSLPGGKPKDPVCPVVELPCKKDETDLMVCLKQGLERGYRDFGIRRALGGDMGHSIAAIRCLGWLREQGAKGTVCGCCQAAVIITPQDGPVDLGKVAPGCLVSHPERNLKLGTRVSVFAYGGDAHGVCESGLEWELFDATLLADDHLGVSNVSVSEHPTLSVGEGRLLAIIG